jgi:hypothetical protein
VLSVQRKCVSRYDTILHPMNPNDTTGPLRAISMRNRLRCGAVRCGASSFGREILPHHSPDRADTSCKVTIATAAFQSETVIEDLTGFWVLGAWYDTPRFEMRISWRKAANEECFRNVDGILPVSFRLQRRGCLFPVTCGAIQGHLRYPLNWQSLHENLPCNTFVFYLSIPSCNCL